MKYILLISIVIIIYFYFNSNIFLYNKKCIDSKIISCECNLNLFNDTINRYTKFKKITRNNSDKFRKKKIIISLLDVREIYQFINNNYEFLSLKYFDDLYFFVNKVDNRKEIYKNISYSIINIDNYFYDFPEGFNKNSTPICNFSKRGKWNYNLMIRFFWKKIFELPILDDVKYLMRLDSDSCLKTSLNPFKLIKNKTYLYNKIISDPSSVVCQLKNFMNDYIDYFKPNIKNIDNYKKTNKKSARLVYYNNFEVLDYSFFLKNEIQDFINFIDLSYGIFIYRWGDAPLRYLLLSIFEKKEKVIQFTDYRKYLHPCE